MLAKSKIRKFVFPKAVLLLTIVVLIMGMGAKKEKLFKPPPQTLRLHDSLYVDIMPIKTKDYRAFLGALKSYYSKAFHDSVQHLPLWGLPRHRLDSLKRHFRGDSVMFQEMLPRTWMTYDNYQKRYEVDYHLTNPRYIEYPVVNITPEHAKMFCQWRTDMIKLYYAVESLSERARSKYPLNFEYRMITTKEWELILYDNFNDVGFIPKGDRETENMNIPKPYQRKGKRKFYYDVDNAGELLAGNDVSIDFQWTSSLKLGSISYIEFKEPSSYITFRCVCEILPVKKVKKKK